MKLNKFIRSFKDKYKQYKVSRKSKRKSFVIGFTTTLSLFSIAIFSRALTAYAKELPIPGPPDPGVVPDLPPTPSAAVVVNKPPLLPPVANVVETYLGIVHLS